MKVLYIHQYFNTPEMNGGTRSYEMARRLVAEGHSVTMVTSDREAARAKRAWKNENIEGINVYWWPSRYSNDMSYFARVRAFFSFAIAARRLAKAIDYDVVFASSTPLTVAIPAVYAARLKSCPLVFEVRDLWPEMPIAVGALRNPLLIRIARQLEKYAYRNATYVVALSPGMARGVVESGVKEENVFVIPNSCDLDLFSGADSLKSVEGAPDLRLGDMPLILYCGTLGVVNGVGYLAEVAYHAREGGFGLNFLVVGKGKEEKAIREKAARLGVLNKNFFMLPVVAKRDVPRFFATATVGCSLFIDLKEMWKNSANKFFDTLAAGRPIVINYRGWQAELIEKHEIGLVLDPNDPAAAASDLASFVTTEDLANVGARAIGLARSEFSRESLAARLREVLLDSLKAYQQRAESK